ncbi:hypothetical protein F5X99DRAFT_252726 [Biscogniauxia marginata]|nr:hypothetical protein F5X99DRAFT_252726 [Biscogniauxia marginata]
MTDPAPEQRSPAADPPHAEHDTDPPPFAPIFTLVNDTSTRTTHHPHVRYIFSDDDPDILTQALAEYNTGIDASAPDPASTHRAMILNLAPNSDGGYSVEWASSLSPSWAVLNADVNQISPSPSDGGSSGTGRGDGEPTNRPDRLMLRIEGIESGALGSEGDLRISGEASRQISGSASGSGSGSGQRDRERGEGEDYINIFDEFERRMSTLRRVVDASEDRRRKIATDPGAEYTETHGITVEETFAG